MPSASEMRADGKNSLACVITRRGGFRLWSEKAKTPMKATDTLTGQLAEEEAEAFLNGLGITTTKQTTKAPFDLLANGHRVDVKSARPGRYGNNHATDMGWIFRIGKKPHTCDFYLLLCYTKKGKIARRFLVPASVAPHTMLTITPHGRCKYDKYQDEFDPLFG